MQRSFVTVDVFTDRMFGGNQLAVVLEAEGLSTAQMQSIAAEFNYAETTFVLPPADPAHTAQVRIFSPRSELPFAGHPNVGTACVLAWRGAGGDRLVFEEIAGLVAMELWREDGQVVGAELTAPDTLNLHEAVDVAQAASCLSLGASAVRTDVHAPRVVSVGMKFLMVQLVDDAALDAARPSIGAQEALLPRHGAMGVYGYVRAGNDLRVRMFAPLDGIAEDAATGSAAAAIVAFLLHLDATDTLQLTIRQGEAMGRPSLLQARAQTDGGRIVASVGGRCIAFMDGRFDLG